MNIEALVKEHIETELIFDRKVDLDLDTNLTGIVDSAGVLELVIWIENTFNISVDIEEITPEDFGSVRRLSDWIRRNAARAAG